MIRKKKDAEDILENLRELHELWINLRKFLLMGFTEGGISSQVEHNFLQVKSTTSKYLRILADKIDAHQFTYEPENITNLLRQAISVTHLRGLPVADRKNLMIIWHDVYVHLSQVLGAFVFIAEGYQPRKKEKKDTSIAALKKSASSKAQKKEGVGKVIFIVILIVLIAGVVFYMMNR